MNEARCKNCDTLLDERGLCWEPHGHLLPDGVATVIEASGPPSNAELLRLLERHHKESIAENRLHPADDLLYSDTELCRETEAAIERAKEKGMSEWISVKDRLPKKRGEFLCYMPKQIVMGNEFGAMRRVLNWTGKRWVSSWSISHWMPLPAPPQPKEQP